MSSIGVVTIGRNEGKRLFQCFKSLKNYLREDVPIVYVDSGSTDGSVALAKSLGIHVIELNMAIPFTMARGRNTGFNYLSENFKDIKYIQFIDGDCEIIDRWIDEAILTLESDEKLAIVCGRRRERFPNASVYNRLADMEWNTSIGETKACGGDALVRVSAIKQVKGYKEKLICGEEPEMCIRLRQLGWKIKRIDADMTLHDAAMLKFSQWWKRSIRGGWAVAEGADMHGATSEKYMVKENISGWLWGAIVPSVALGCALHTSGLSLLLFLGYVFLMWRIYKYRQNIHGDLPSTALLYAFFCVLSKLPQVVGQIKYWLTRWQGKQAKIIEYKTVVTKKPAFQN